ncbi:MAG TPA: Na/Pi cotransporter family protein [Rectinemataceae bacterium]|nr:Na/Pi cotransporter family protein [Rectinemataceae bacterium]
MEIVTMFLELLGGLALFMYGMDRTSDGIQRAAGEKLQSTLNFMTKNRLMAVLTGTLVTVAVQSSSATTVMLITFVNAGLLSLTQGIGVIMGANIGTTLTGWIIAAVGIAKFSIASLAVPIFGAGFFMSIMKKRSDAFRSYGSALTGLALIFLGLGFIADAIPEPSREILLFLQNFSDMGFIAIILAVLAGMVFTILINASSATLAIVIAMASQGIIDFNIAAAITLGANIGTTFDAFLASISTGASANAKRAAWAHILFNVLGTIWVIIVFNPFMAFVDWVVPGPITTQSMGIHIAMLHTLFNTVNTIILLPFINQYAALLNRLIKEKPEEAEMRAIYLPTTLKATPELSLIHARKEIADMAAISQAMFARVRKNIVAEAADFDAEIAWFTAKENYLDMMHEELSKFLIAITRNDLSEKTRNRVGMKLRIIAELENMSDECLSIAFLLKKKRNKHLGFEPESLGALRPFADMVDEFLGFVAARLHTGMTEIELGMASEMEDKIDAFKKHLKKHARKRLDAGADVKAELLYIDLIRHVEKMGDCAYAISEELRHFSV